MVLQIYDPLVKVVKKHLRKNNIDAKVSSYIGKAYHRNRYTQVIPESWNNLSFRTENNVHYEYINGYWELHFENNSEYELLMLNAARMDFTRTFSTSSTFKWHNWQGKQRGLLRLEEKVYDEDDFLPLFDKMYAATYDVLSSVFDNIESNYDLDANNYYDFEDDEEEVDAEDDDDFEDDEEVDAEDDDDFEDDEEVDAEDVIIASAAGDYTEPEDPRIVTIARLPFSQFAIPAYQRAYKWNEQNVNQLIADILEFSNRSEYRLGTLVLFHNVNDPEQQLLEIVDGQQRIVTLSLLLSQLQLGGRYSNLKDSLTTFLEKKQFNDPISKANIQNSLTVISHRLNDFTEESVSFLLNKCKFVVITLHDISEAFQFFDSQNARGKELAPHDLLKAFHLRAIGDMSKMSKADESNIKDWEQHPTEELESLFLMLYRIKRWANLEEAREFTSQDVGEFKGFNADDCTLPRDKIYRIAQEYSSHQNELDYPHQIDQIVINGSIFFDMIRYYYYLSHKVLDAKDGVVYQVNPKVMQAVDSLNEGKGNEYIRLLFEAACLFYYDKFGENNMKQAIDRIFAWAYGKRMRAYAVKLATMDNLAIGKDDYATEGFFSMLHKCVKPNDVLDWSVPVLSEEELAENQKGCADVIGLLKELHYVK